MPVQQQVQVMHRERQLSENLRRVIVQVYGFQTPLRALKAQTERDVFVVVAQFAQQLSDFIRALTRPANHTQRSGRIRLAGGHGLKQGAIEIPAAHRSVGVNPAGATCECRTRLRKFGDARFGNGQPERSELCCVVARL